MTKTHSGGGRTPVHASAPKVEPKARAMSPGAVSQLGAHVGRQRAVEPLVAGPGYKPPVGPTQSGVGPGAGRTVHRSGSQGQQGPVAPGEGRPSGSADTGARAILGPSKGKTI